jgi:hypothetical protein
MKKSKGNMKDSKPISKAKLEKLKQYQVDDQYTKQIPVTDRISFRIRKSKVVSPDGTAEGIDIRRFMLEYPTKQGCMIPMDKWLDLIQEAINFTVDLFGQEVFYQPESTTKQPTTPQPQKRQSLPPPLPNTKARLQEQNIDNTNWIEITKKK